MLKVKELLEWDIMKDNKILGGHTGLDKEVKGVTIIEAPDIVKFINGGEVLLTGLYAFRSCSAEEFKNYIYKLADKKISALILKLGRDVELAEVKVSIIREFANQYSVPVLEVPFEVSFKDILSPIMEQLFNEEVKRLKYFKATHDNFDTLALSRDWSEDGMARILNLLGKLIENPVALYNQNMVCLGTSDSELCEADIQEDAHVFEPEISSNYQYIRQEIYLANKKTSQYFIQLNPVFGVKVYLVVTEMREHMDAMDYIAVESSLTALQYEFSRQYAITELEKKYQYDIMHNILNGKVSSVDEVRQDIGLLGMDFDASYRVIVLEQEYKDKKEPKDISLRMKNMKVLNEVVKRIFSGARIQNDLDNIVVVNEENEEQDKGIYQKQIKNAVNNIQNQILEYGSECIVKAGVGNTASGIVKLHESYKQANDALAFLNVAGSIFDDYDTQVLTFSDMGILKLLYQIKTKKELMEYVPESLRRLQTYKKGHRDDLLLTLRIYLDRNQNLSKTARDLYIHYKTAAYRIERISEITGIDFDNPSEVLAVRLGLIVYKIIDNKFYS